MKILATFFVLCFMMKATAQQPEYAEITRALDSINRLDQGGREKSESIQLHYKNDTAKLRQELEQLWKQIHIQDSMNQVAVMKILDTEGWLGPREIGEDANSTLFLVIQHADLPIQEKYLPMMKTAVQNKKAKPSQLALLEDRVALRKGKKQLYGSQIGWDMIRNDYYVQPLEDPDHVDERRASMGLPPMAEYVRYWNMKWDVEQYKKDLPQIMKRFNGQ
ncbi:DUF6624 domain-containing protein [Pollutibacter soli]|uniref:DUF6624 domain-containing protein n=1 Tax=Pollutibacter soli TaxID=3034157 RepID=UPI0030132929